MRFGNGFSSSGDFGYISNLRIVQNTAVYTANFTPPTSPLVAITNTSLLTCQSNRFIDNSTNAFALTATGAPITIAFCPFNPSASYSTATYSGGGYFSGSTDYLSFPGILLNGDFCAEAWVYKTTNPTNYAVVFGGSSVGGANNNQFYITNAGGLNLVLDAIGVITGSSGVFVNNQWNHCVWLRKGTAANNCAVFLNGVRQGQGSSTDNFSICSRINDIASLSGYKVNGLIANARIVVGNSVYDPSLTTLTVPTTPLTAIANTSLLLNFSNAGIYDATTINDEATVGTAQVSTAQAKFGTTSMFFNGTTDWLTMVDSPPQRLGSGDFTIEGWVYLAATGVAYGIVSKGTATTGWSVNVTAGNKLQFSYTSSNLTGATSLAATTWYYFAVVRSGTATGNLKVYLNGSADATSAGAVTDNFNQTNTMYVGADRVGTSPLNGYIDELRITNGYARTISTPTAAFPTK